MQDKNGKDATNRFFQGNIHSAGFPIRALDDSEAREFVQNGNMPDPVEVTKE